MCIRDSSYPGHFFAEKKGSSKRLAAASLFAYEDKRMAARVLHLGAFMLNSSGTPISLGSQLVLSYCVNNQSWYKHDLANLHVQEITVF